MERETMWIVAAVVAGAMTIARYVPSWYLRMKPSIHASITSGMELFRWSVGTVGRIARYGSLAGFALGILILNVYLFSVKSDLPDLDPLIAFRPHQIGNFYDADGEVVMRMATSYREPVGYGEIPQLFSETVLSAEDKRFFSRFHTGVDIFAWPRVLWMRSRGNSQGGSTITQQLVRTMFLEDMLKQEWSGELSVDNIVTRELAERKGARWTNSIIRKVIEVKYALYAERALTDHFEQYEEAWDTIDRYTDGPRRRARRRAKEHILTCYSNLVYLGHGVYGFSYASRFYFGKDMQELEPHEAALLVSFIPFPGPFANLSGTEQDLQAKKDRRDTILQRMTRNGYLSEKVRLAQSEVPVTLTPRSSGGKTIAPAAVNLALKEVKTLDVGHDDIASGFAHPHMTMDLDIQRALNGAIESGKENFAHWWPEFEMPQMAVVVLRNSDAAILALYGGHLTDTVYNYSSYNRAVDARRQPGSTFKAIDAMAAVRAGYLPESVLNDAPFPIPMGRGTRTHWVGNYDGRFFGPIVLREVIAQSRNAPTIRMTQSLPGTYRDVIDAAYMLGIKTELELWPTTALGASVVTPLELANAFRAIASGVQAEPYIVSRVTDEDGRILTVRGVHTKPLPVSPKELAHVQELLRGTVRLPRGTSHSLDSSSFGIPLGAKTGTTNDHKDAWHCAFTYGPDGITSCVWVGYDDSTPLPHRGVTRRAAGASAALPINRALFERVYGEDSPLGQPPRFPESIEESITNYIFWTYEFPESYK